MRKYLAKEFRKAVPQPEPGSGRGGFTLPVTDWTRLERFLILGNESGSYSAGERSLTLDNAGAVARCLAQDGVRAVNTIAGVSESGRAPENDPALFALAMAASCGDEETRQTALAALSRVARTGTHLLRFAFYVDGMRGWGRGLRRAVARWYVEQPLEHVACQVTMYRERDGWSHRDLLRLAHPKADDERDALFQWVVTGGFGAKRPAEPEQSELRVVEAMEQVHSASSTAEVASLIRVRGLTREMVPPDFLNEREVWEALLERMPLPVMLHSLVALTRAGALTPSSEATSRVTARLRSGWAIRKAKLHPVAVLAAMLAYKAGRSSREQHRWSPSPEVVGALEDAFQLAFANVPATGKRHYVAVDVSGSMGSGEVGGVAGLTPRMAAAAMAMTIVRAEPHCHLAAFADGMAPLEVVRSDSLADVCRKTEAPPFGAIDCALPMLASLERQIPVDVFVVLTDSETRFGGIHPAEALRRYRETMRLPAKLAVVGMASGGFRIADPDDAGMLDVAGFDAAVPELIADFAAN